MAKEESLLPRVNMPPFAWVVTVVDFLLLGACFAGGVLAIVFGEGNLLVHSIIFFVGGVVFLFSFVFKMILFVRSLLLKNDCLRYLAEEGEFELNPIFGKSFRVGRKDLLSINRGFWSSFTVIARFRQDGKVRGVYLGWSNEVPFALVRIAEIKRRP